MAKKSNNIFLILGIGCAVIVLLGGLAVVGVGYFGMKQVQQIEADMRDPDAASKKVLGVDALPEGYYAQMALTVPFLMDVVQISDVPKPSEETALAGNNGLFYIKMINPGEKQEMYDFFEGRSDNPVVLRNNGVQMDVGEVMERGRLSLGDQEMRYITYRGDITIAEGGAENGLNTMFMVECPGSGRLRIGVRYGPDPNPGTAPEQLQLEDTVNHPDNLTNFLSYFNFCI